MLDSLIHRKCPGRTPEPGHSWLGRRFGAFLAYFAILSQLFAASLPMAPADMMTVAADGHSIICSSEQPAKSAPTRAPKSTDHKTTDCVVCQAQQLFSAALTPEPVAFVSPLVHHGRPVLSVSQDAVVTAVLYRAQQPRAPPLIA